jgi:hypothetical protein
VGFSDSTVFGSPICGSPICGQATVNAFYF